jgi:hypothetical protein
MQYQTTMGQPLPRPLGLLAELTHRCPLGCPYCSNPIALESRADEIDTATWARVFAEAADPRSIFRAESRQRGVISSRLLPPPIAQTFTPI